MGAADDVDEDEGVEGDEGGGAERVDAAGRGEAGDEDGERQDRARPRPPSAPPTASPTGSQASG